MVRRVGPVLVLLPTLMALAQCTRADEFPSGAGPTPAPTPSSSQTATTQPLSPTLAIVRAAREQIGKTVTYDPAYRVLEYPGGDVPLTQGVCTDVVVRALRTGIRSDLQKLVHEDMTQAFAQYPPLWGLKAPDANIDHRRVPNLQRYFERQGWALAVTAQKEDYLPGDLVTCTVAGKLPHIMIVSDRTTADGTPYVIHNIGRGTQEEPRLLEFPLTGHYRVAEKPPPQRPLAT